jgi:hypothetical protein
MMPAAVQSPTTWPPFLRPFVARLGPAVVWSAGLESVGYPPTLIDRYGEALPLLEALQALNP